MKTYSIVYADPPWYYDPLPEGDSSIMDHYPLMFDDELLDFNIRRFMKRNAILFLWATTPRLNFAFECLKAWRLHYKGVAFVWVKTRNDGLILRPTGKRPAVTKSITEVVLAATTTKGAPFPVVDIGVRQVVMAPRREHSRKPDEVANRIERIYGNKSRIELFARERREGWDAWGNEV